MDILEEITKRKSGRVFSGKPVPREILESILEAGRWAPSCANTQAWNYLVLTDKVTLSSAHEAFSKGNAWGKKAPVMVLVTSTESGGCPAHNLPYFMMDVGLTTQNMLLQAVHSVPKLRVLFCVEKLLIMMVNTFKQKIRRQTMH